MKIRCCGKFNGKGENANSLQGSSQKNHLHEILMKISCFGKFNRKRMPTLFRQLQTSGKDVVSEPPERATTSLPSRNSSSKRGEMGENRPSHVRVEVRREFLRTTTNGTEDEAFTNPETLPSVEAAYENFLSIYPKFAETWAVDILRDREYFHLEESQHVCMDYCGFGLFSYYQQIVNKASSSFGLAYISANLPTHALYGAADEGTAEFYIKKRVMNYLNINDTEYSMVFTASRGSAFKLLAESYPFHLNPKLLTVYDFESEAVNWMAECAKQRGAKITSACFKWPLLRIGTSHLKKLLQEKRKKGESAKGLFVFPVQSRMTGAKYSYQWMSEAQQNKWHVLLDASSFGPKDMDSLGLSLFRPDFIVSSFYKVFGTDPTGFGCLFIKNTAIHSLHDSSRARAVGMVRVVSPNNYTADGPEVNEFEDDGEDSLHESWSGFGQQDDFTESSFSGPFFTAAEGEVKTKHKAKESNWRASKSSKRSSKMARHNREHSQLTGSNGLTETVTGIGERDFREVEVVARPTTSEIEEEQPNQAKETVQVRDRARRLYEWSENDIQELGDDKVSEVGSSRQVRNPQWPAHGRVTGIQEEYNSVEFHKLRGKGISPIREEDMEDDEEVEEHCGSELFRKASESANENGGAHMMFTDGRREGGANGIEEVDRGRNFMSVLPRFDAEAIEDAGSSFDESQPGSGLDVNDTESEEISEQSLSAKRHQHAIDEVSNAEERGESSDVFVIEEHIDDIVKPHVLCTSDAGSHSSAQARPDSFARSASFENHTGKRLSDFQEMGDQGLVQNYQSLHSGNACYKEFESTVDEGSRPVQTADLTLGRSPRSARGIRNVAEVSAMENSGQFDTGFESVNSNLATAIKTCTRNTLGVRGTVAENYRGRATAEPSSRCPGAGGYLKQEVDIVASATDGDSNCRGEEDPSFLETKAASHSNRPEAFPLAETGRSPQAGFKPGTALMEPLRKNYSLEEFEKSTDLNRENLPCQENTVCGLQHSSLLGVHRRARSESGEENFITIVPDRTVKNWNKSVTEIGIAAGTSGSQEPSNNETTCASSTGQREYLRTMDDPSSPEKKCTGDHSWQEESLFKPARSSPSTKLDKNLPPITTPLYDVPTPSYLGTERSSADSIYVNLADFHDAKGHGLRNGRFDLRDNRTLSRNVDFVGELYRSRPSSATDKLTSRRQSTRSGRFDLRDKRTLSRNVDFVDELYRSRPSSATEQLTSRRRSTRNGRFDLRDNRTLSRNVDFVDELYRSRPSSVTDKLTSRRQPTALAEDIARLHWQDSDEESPFHSQHRSGSLHGYSTSGYLENEVQPASYREAEDSDTEDEYGDVPQAASRESRGEPMISCKGLDFADSVGLTKLNYRLRYLVNWLVNSLLKLRHPGPNEGVPLVRIYGPKVKYDRGAAVSFNIFDWKGVLIAPGIVQRLADRSNISLGVGRLCNIVDPEMSPDFMAEKERLLGVEKIEKSGVDNTPCAGKVDAGKCGSAGDPVIIPVVTAAMGFVTSFEDVYKLWSFLAKFLDADYVSKEVWRYYSLNQQIMVM